MLVTMALICENLFEQAGQLVIGLGDRAACLLVGGSRLIDALP